METFLQQDQLRELLQVLMQDTFGPRVEVHRSQVANRQHDYLVLLLDLRRPDRQVVLKLAGPQAAMSGAFQRTAVLQRLLAAQTDLPLAEILAVDVSCRSWPWRYLIQSRIPGQEWAQVRLHMSREALASAYRQIGQAVAELHSLRFPAFGELDENGRVPDGAAFLQAFAARARAAIASPRLQELFLVVLEANQRLFERVSQPRLCHEDLHGHNLLFHNQHGQWRLAAVLDFDKSWAGHHEIDLARMAFWEGMTAADFWQEYEGVWPPEAGYEQRRQIYQLLWCFEYARPTRKHLQDTLRLCAELGIACPPNFER